MGAPLPREMRCSTSMHAMEEPKFSTRKWYLSCQEIEKCSPSRKDGIDLEQENHLRKSYCSFLRKLGMKLDMSQVAIACGMMLCHQFYMHQSHAKNDWQTIVTVSIFLAGKIMETPRFPRDVVTVAYEMIYDWDPFASHKIRQREVYDQQKELIVVGERLLLATIAYDLNIELPYKPLVAALKRLKIHPDLPKVAWNFVNDWLCTTLCLQYRPQYIAAGSLFLAAKFLKVKLQMEEGKVWWLEFDISSTLLEEVIQQMLRLLEQDRKEALTSENKRFTQANGSARKPIIIHTGSNTKWDSCNGAESNELSISVGSGGRQPSRKDALYSQTTASGTSSAIEDIGGEVIASSQACRHRQVRVKKVLQRQTSDGATSGSVEDSKVRMAESHPDTSIKTLSAYHTSSKIYTSQNGETLKKRKEVSDGAGNPPLGEAKKKVLRH